MVGNDRRVGNGRKRMKTQSSGQTGPLEDNESKERRKDRRDERYQTN